MKKCKEILEISTRCLRNNRGDGYINELFGFAIIMALILSFVVLPEPFVKKQNLDYMATSIVRAVETTGEINADIYQLIEDFKRETGLNPTIHWEGNFVGHGSSDRIQIRERFSLTLTYKVVIKIAEPTFSRPINVEVPLTKTVKGMSEVYWKPGQI